MKKIIPAVAIVFALAGCGGPASSTPTPTETPTPDTFTAKGTISVTRTMIYGKVGQACSGIGGFSDMTEGAQVVITDASSTVVGVGQLDEGMALQLIEGQEGTSTCAFSFEVAGVPEGSAYYGVEVSHRGVLQMPRSKMESMDLSLG